MTFVIDPLCGKSFDQARQNCYTLVRDFYRLNFAIELADYACPTDWWHAGLDIFRDLAWSEGMRLVDEPPHAWRAGDVIVMAIGAAVGNHLAVLLPGNRIIHHMAGQLSGVTQYGGLFRNNTVAVYRHPGVSLPAPSGTLSLAEVLRPHARRKLENLIARQNAEGTSQ